MQLDINTDALVKHTVKLEKVSRSALPVAVRSALNSCAFDMKKNTLPASAAENFTLRRPSFFKAKTAVDSAKGFDINTMQAAVGFSGKDQAIDDMEQQEYGGQIGSRSFIPMAPARTGNAPAKSVRANARLSGIRNIVKAKDAKGKNDAEKFVKSVIYAGKGGFVLADYKDKQILWRVNSLKRDRDGGFKLTPLYSFEKGRDVNVKATNFLEEAAEITIKDIERYYLEAAEKQLEKHLNK